MALRLRVLLMLGLLILVAFTPIGSNAVHATAARSVPVGAFLYLWYGYNSTSGKWTGGLGTSHWNDSSGGVVKDTPAIGYYASDDNQTLAWQLSNMKAAGITVIVVSWWGYGQDSGGQSILDRAIDNATLNLFKYLQANPSLWNFKVALMVEPYNTTTMTASDYSRLYGYLYARIYHPFNSSIFYWEGKPLLLSFNPQRLPANDTFTYRYVGGHPNLVDWTFWTGSSFLDSYGGKAVPSDYQSDPVISSDGEVGITPRYDDYYLYLAHERPGFMRFDYRMNEGLYSYEWNYVINRAPEVNLVLLYGWNEYHERTELEPHADFTARNPVGPTDTHGLVSALDSAGAPKNQPDGNDWTILILIAASLILMIPLLVVLWTRRKSGPVHLPESLRNWIPPPSEIIGSQAPSSLYLPVFVFRPPLGRMRSLGQ